ncbi:hypothetical protein NX059_006997 [Plenodomus lindquistii]|nr:hypothetical protein NX059_006997 [Plenodomus lindquistii]
MFAPRAPSAFVCLRCEVQLARRSLPRFAHHTSQPKFSTSARHGNDEAAQYPQDALSQLEPPPLKITKEKEPLDRTRRHKGKTIRETSARLGGIKTLGDDAEILVLREVAESAEEAAAKQAENAPTEMPRIDVPDIAASVEEESKPLSLREIHQQIEALRPAIQGDPDEPQYVSQATFLKLNKLLMTGFTLHQLSGFYSIAKNVKLQLWPKEVINRLKGDKGTPRNPTRRSDWQPGTTKIEHRLPGLDVTLRSKKQPVSKQLLVDRILRDCWKMELLEEIEAPGEIELSLQPWQIMLLNVGESDTILDRIGQTRRAKFEVHQEHSVLRITADKTTAEYAANDIEEALKNVAAKTLNLRPWLSVFVEGSIPGPRSLTSVFTQNDLDTVSTLTRTCIETVQGAFLSIRGLDASSVAEAERTLIRFLPLKDGVTHSVDTQGVEAATNSNHLLPVFLTENTLDQKNRQVEFGRNTMPVVRTAVSDAQGDSSQQGEPAEKPSNSPETYAGHIDHAVAALHRSTKDKSTSPKSINSWPAKPEYILTAELGQVLFPLPSTPPSQKSSTPTSESSTLTSPLSPMFYPSTPGLTSLLTSPHFTATARMQAPGLIYSFVPSPFQTDFKRGQLFPELRIQMRTGRSGTPPHLHSVTLGFDKRVHNVLLPSKPSDLRFRSSARLKMKGGLGVDVDVPAVKEWIERVVENIESGGRLWAPDLTLDIPAWTIPGFGAKTVKEKQELKPVTYLFSGIQFRQSVSGIIGETMVSYRTTQSGKLNAKFGVLGAHYSGNGDLLLRDEAKVRTFAEEAFKLVDLVGEGAGATVPVSKRMNPRAVVSARKIRREQERAAQRARGEDGGEGEGEEEGEERDVGLEKPWEPLEEDEKQAAEDAVEAKEEEQDEVIAGDELQANEESRDAVTADNTADKETEDHDVEPRSQTA